MAVNGGVRNWASGEVLDAEELNEFVADQTIARFATIADRTAAYGVSGAPALQKGLFSWVEATEKLYYYSGTAWVEVGAQIEAGEITNTEISATAAIALSKLASGTSAQVIVHNSSGVPTATTVTGDVTITNTGVTAISSGVIVDADVSASAAIALSKLTSGTSGQIIVANSSGVPTWVSETGDVTISDTGVTAISSGVIVNADVSASAAIELGKLADVTIDTKTANYTLALTDKNKIIETNITSTANTVSIPTDASVNFPIGSQITVTQYGTGKTQIVAVTPATTSIRATPGQYLRAQYSSATLIKRAANEWYLIGDLSAS
jgi:sporulation protein YlmC with PRC-barrel domain